MDNFTKVYRIGEGKTHGGRAYSVYVKAAYTDGKLSITGVEGPLRSGGCLGSFGQIDISVKPEDLILAPGWTLDSVKRLFAIWDEWHLNDMQAGCEHQRANWDLSKKITVTRYRQSSDFNSMLDRVVQGKLSGTEYESIRTILAKVHAVMRGLLISEYETSQSEELIGIGFLEVSKTEEKPACQVRPEEHPEGLLCKPCEVCGYEYGSAWRKQDVPEDVLQELKDFPDTDRTPAWV